MSKADKTLAKIANGTQDANLEFGDLCKMLIRLGFQTRIKGSHHLFIRSGFDLINLQSAGNKAKPYQVRQVRDVSRKGGLI